MSQHYRLRRRHLFHQGLIASLAIMAASAAEPVTAGYDSLPDAGSGVFHGGVLFDVEIAPNQNLVIQHFEFQARTGQSSVWNYSLYFREGSLMDTVGGLPAHRVAAAWQRVGSVPGVASPTSATWFRIDLDEGPSGTTGLVLGPGRYAFYLDSALASGASGTSNGVRTVNPGDPTTRELFDPFFSTAELTFLTGGSKGGAFGSTLPDDNLRAPREMSITYLGGSGERVRSAYETWIEERLPAGSPLAQALEDPDGDRIPNVLEWALGGDPLIAFAANRLIPSPDADGPRWQFIRRTESAGPVALVLETSADMSEWQRHPVPETTGEGFTITPESSVDGFEWVVARLPVPQAVGNAFARLAMDAARVVAVDARHYDGPYLVKNGESVREIRVSPGADGPLISDVTHPDGMPADTIAIYPDAGAPGDDTKHAPFLVKLRDFPVEEAWDFAQPERIFAIADLECGFSETESILRAGGVIDEKLNWIYGDGHLVVNGDVFSRGTDMMALLWLLYKLDHESRAAGGRMHLLMGNHEWMNLSGDERYVVPRYLETAAELEMQFKDLFGSDTELGRWLRTKNSIIRIGRTLFVHAGISPDFISRGYTPQEANALVRGNIGLRTSQMDGRAEFLFRTFGPLWYRGMVSTRANHSPITTAEIDPILEHFEVDRVVVGHTKSNEIRHHRDRRVVGIDVDHTGARTRGDTRALRIERGNDGDVLRAIDDEGTAREIPLRD